MSHTQPSDGAHQLSGPRIVLRLCLLCLSIIRCVIHVTLTRFGSGMQSSGASNLTPGVSSTELKKKGFLGRGTYGIVFLAEWVTNGRTQTVAVKEMTIGDWQNDQQSDHCRIDFRNEIASMERVKHKNIIRLLARSLNEYKCCLIMEYAECGNLYDLLHSPSYQKVNYEPQHAISWSLQTASALAYLHSLTPRALVHRDVKPPNLLLKNYCRVVKICDFGIACDVRTHMTTNRGSANWMAPEVFKSVPYSEKCDTFSFGVTVWEIFSRKRPFANVGNNPYAIMWAVSDGKRPPLFQNCPPALEELLERCWHQEPDQRPSMRAVEERLEQMARLVVKDVLQPIHLPPKSSQTAHNNYTENQYPDSLPFVTVTEPANRDLYSFLNQPPAEPDNYLPFPNTEPTSGSQENLLEVSTRRRRQSSERMLDPQPPPLPPHSSFSRRRVDEASGLQSIVNRPASPSMRNGTTITSSSSSSSKHTAVTSSSAHYDEVATSSMQQIQITSPALRRSGVSSPPDEGYKTISHSNRVPVYVSQIEPKYRPVQPDPSNAKSVNIFSRHQELCHEFKKLDTECKLLNERNNELDILSKRMMTSGNRSDFRLDIHKELDCVSSDIRDLEAFRMNLKGQLEELKRRRLHQEIEQDGFHPL